MKIKEILNNEDTFDEEEWIDSIIVETNENFQRQKTHVPLSEWGNSLPLLESEEGKEWDILAEQRLKDIPLIG